MRAHRPATGILLVFWLLAVAPGCDLLGGDGDDTPTSPTAPDPNEIVYAALGASDAVAVGASVSCTPFVACPDGTGYVQVIARRLAASNKVSLSNLGIPAAVIGPGFQELGNRYGRTTPGNLLEREMPFVPRTSTLVTILAGGNDTNVIATAVEGGAGGSDALGYIDAQVRAFGADYDNLIRGIRQRTPSAKIVVANLPNFAGIPMTAGISMPRKQGIQKISVDLSTRVINGLAASGVQVVDVLCDPRFYEPGSYSGDGFHPNDRGYAILADLMMAAISAGSHPPPRASCPQMTLVPPL